MLQVCIDDTRTEPNQGPAFILAGFLAREKIWESFADDWKACCTKSPAIGFVKGKQAFDLKGPFKGWTAVERDKKLLALVALIKKYRLIGVGCAVNHRHWANSTGRLTLGNSPVLKTPEYAAVAAVTSAVLGWILESGRRQKVSFIYDYDLISRRELQSGYRSMLRRLPRQVTELVAREPQFQDDKEFLPLQAADLYAYCAGRNAYLRAQGKRFESTVWDAFANVELIDASLYRSDIQALTRDILIDVEKNYGVQLLHLAAARGNDERLH